MIFTFIQQLTTSASMFDLAIDPFEKLAKSTTQGLVPPDLAKIIHNFYLSYGEAIAENGYSIQDGHAILNQFLDLVIEQLKRPFVFEPFHKSIVEPFDYYQFGLNLLRPLVVFSKSKAEGLEHVDTIVETLNRGENVILFGNHQTEPDPQAISLLLEKTHPKFAEQIIFVAGHRVISDPLAVPFSKGCNLLCIFSKRYIETTPELKKEKQSHNQRTMKKMSQMLSEGGKCIYVAPSGGRDRPGPKGKISVAPFDPQSIEMFWLMANQAERNTYFHTLALSTYNLLPPPSSIEASLGERRVAHCTPIHLAFGPAVDMERCVDSNITDKRQRRKQRADYIWRIVANDYARLNSGIS